MAKYLITGGCGFIGSHLAHFLVNRGSEVCILDDLSSGKKENAPKHAELLIGSITDPKSVERALEGVEGVFHLAAIPSVQQSFDRWHAVHQINSGGTVQLYEALTKLPKKIPLIYASSSAVYGCSPHTPINEKTPTAPLSPYGIDKLSGEWQAKILWNVFQIPSISFRFFNVFGPHQDASSPYSGVISNFSKRLAKNLPLIIYGNGEQVRDFIYVEDVVRTLTEAMVNPLEGAHIYNLCTGKGTTVNQLADLMGKVAGISIKKEYAPPREGDIRLSIGDPSLAKRSLKFKPAFTLEEGLRELRKACV